MTNFDFTSMEQIEDIESHNVYRLASKLHFPKRFRWNMIRLVSRDNARTPMQWSSGHGGGFTAGKPWIGVNGNHKQINVEAQAGNADSILSYYRKLIALRNGSEILRSGEFKKVRVSRNLFVYDRILNNEKITVIINFSKTCKHYPAKGELLLSTYDRKTFDGSLKPYEAVLIRREDAT